MHPALTDVVTHLGAVKDTERDSEGSAGVARVPMALGLYKAMMPNKHVKIFPPAFRSGLKVDGELLTQ